MEPDIIGRSYEYLIRKFAEGSGQSAGEFYTPAEVGLVMARIMEIEPGMDVYDPCCGSASLLIKCSLECGDTTPLSNGATCRADQSADMSAHSKFAPAKLYGQENEPGTWAMANMNMIIYDMEGEIQIGDTFRKPKFRQSKNGRNRLQTFDRVVANPMWNQTEFKEKDYDADELDRFAGNGKGGVGYPGGKAEWGWMQHVLANLKNKGRAAVLLDTGAALLKNLSIRLTREFGKGFTETNLKYFRQFYLAFLAQTASAIRHTLCDQLAWPHYRLLMRVEKPDARAWYLKEAADQNWSVRALERQISALYYERLLMSRDMSRQTQSGDTSPHSRVFERGVWRTPAHNFQSALTSREFKLKPKSANIAGLQLSDLRGHPVKHWVLRQHEHTDVDLAPFAQRLLKVVEGKFNRHLYNGRIEGYGSVLYPKK